MTVAGAGARGDEGALAAVLPASAQALWVDDASLGRDLVLDGYDLSSDYPDVAIVTDVAHVQHAPRADTVVVLLDGARMAAPDGSRAHDAAARLRAHVRVRTELRQARRELRRRGLGSERMLSWDYGVPLRPGTCPTWVPALHQARNYPRRMVLVAGKRTAPTLLELALHQAQQMTDERDTDVDGTCPPLVSPGGTLLLTTGSRVLRLGLGRGRRQVEAPAFVLGLLGEPGNSEVVATRAPSLLARGRTGGASWSLEQRMPGRTARPPITGPLLDDCVTFLVALHQVRWTTPGSLPDVGTAAVAVSRLCQHGELVQRLARAADEQVSGLPRGFGHGDFWHRNLLLDGRRLVGVVDWDSAAGGRLPFVDLMHLMTSQQLRPGGHSWGRALVETLLPWADRGGDQHTERYAAALGIALSPALLRALVTAYWLDWLGYQLTHYADRGSQGRWVRGNVDLVVDALVTQR